MSSDPLRLLIVDDAPDHAEMVVEFVRLNDGWRDAAIDAVTSYEEAIAALERTSFDLAFFDYWLGERTGLMLLRELRTRGVTIPVVILTSRGAEEIAVEAMKAGAADYLSKTSLTVESLERAVHHAVALRAGEQQRRRAEAALRASEERFRALVENSSEIRKSVV